MRVMESYHNLGLTFDDVLLVPQYSDIRSRAQVDIRAKLIGDIELKVPIIAANMDTVCESEMAIKMAQLGGVGIIHRYLSITEQAQQVSEVKNFNEVVIPNPYVVEKGELTEVAIELMIENNVSSVIVVDGGVFEGILPLTSLTFEQIEGTLVEQFMITKEDAIVGTIGMSLEEAKDLIKDYKVGKIPLLDKEGVVRGLITRKDLFKKQDCPHATFDKDGRLVVGAAIGINNDYLERAQSLIEAGVDFLVVDIAHGDSFNCIDAIVQIKDVWDIPIMAGNVATKDAVSRLIEAGVDAIKVGVGPGSICTTRIVTGHGVPQLTAILDCARSMRCMKESKRVPLVADGGIRTSGDIVKALGAGASCVMVGSLLAGTEEAPGQFIHKNGTRYKMVRGMASYGAALGREKRAGDKISSATPEGVEGLVPYRGYAEEVITNLVGGIRSGFSYSGAATLESLWERADFIRITNSGLRESNHHDVQTI